MSNQQYLKIAGVLLLSVLMLIPASAAVANTNKAAISLEGGITKVVTTTSGSKDVLYDNGMPDAVNGLSCGVWSTYNREIVDDFTNSEEWQVTGGEYRIVLYGSGTSIDGTLVSFYQDSGGVPSLTPYATPTATITCTPTGNYYFSRPELLVTCSFDAVTLPAGTWWVCFQSQANDNPFWLSAPYKGSCVYVSYPDLGYPKWTSGFTVWAVDYDVSFVLTGGGGGDTTPPVTTCDITGTNPVTITLTATDDDSGVDYTKYKIDDGTYETYTAPVQVTEVGDHTVYYYSADLEGNIEDEQSQTFTVEAPAVEITIKGGLGVSATIKNTGATDLTDVAWSINLDGSLIFVGKTKSGTIASLAAGESVTVKDFVIGIGKTGIAATAGTASASASGTVLLFLVIGVA